MKKRLLILLITIINLNCYAQISFEKGYFINNANEKIECLIKNNDWRNNPIEFEYKLSENETPKIASIESIKEFGIYDMSKYERYSVDIDRSSKVFGEMSTVKNPVFKKEQLFLKVLVEGEASLFFYQDGNLNRFFYKTSTTEIAQLIFKSFRTNDDEVAENNRFKQQLYKDLKCEGLSFGKIRNIDYRKNELVNFFITFNQCKNSEFINFENKQKKDLFNLTVRPGFYSSSLTIENHNSSTRNAEFGNDSGIRIGLEAEFILPFNKNKWAILIEPTYQQFNGETEILGIPTSTIPFDTKISVEYTSIEVPIGFRHYMFLDQKSKLFMNAAIIVDFSSNSKFDFEKLSDLEIKSSKNFVVGFGYKYDNTYSVEFRVGTNRDLLSTHSAWSSDYKSVSIIVGYTLF